MAKDIYQERTPPTDPLVILYRELDRELKTIHDRARVVRSEMASLKAQMKTGTCQHCGQPFARHRVTRLFCSPQCAVQAGGRDARYSQSNLPLVLKHWPVVTMMMTPESVRILTLWRDAGGQTEAALVAAVSHQRVNQITVRASRLAMVAEVTLQTMLRKEETVTK